MSTCEAKAFTVPFQRDRKTERGQTLPVCTLQACSDAVLLFCNGHLHVHFKELRQTERVIKTCWRMRFYVQTVFRKHPSIRRLPDNLPAGLGGDPNTNTGCITSVSDGHV